MKAIASNFDIGPRSRWKGPTYPYNPAGLDTNADLITQAWSFELMGKPFFVKGVCLAGTKVCTIQCDTTYITIRSDLSVLPKNLYMYIISEEYITTAETHIFTYQVKVTNDLQPNPDPLAKCCLVTITYRRMYGF